MLGEIAAANRPALPPASASAAGGNIPSATAQTPLQLAVISPAQTAVGSTFQVTVQASNAHDLFGVPLQMQFDPKVVALVNVDAGEMLGRDGQAVALTHRDDGQGAVSINLERPPQTKGIDGQGRLCVLTFKAIAPGSSQLALVRVGARDSRQQNMPALGSQANVRVTAAASVPGPSH
jgi:general secretion pathway protein D